MRARRKTWVFTLTVIVSSLMAYPAYACSCGKVAGPKTAFLHSELVFVGVLKGKSDWTAKRELDIVEESGDVIPSVNLTRFQVQEVYKGDLEPGQSIIIRTIGTCDPGYGSIGSTWLIYARQFAEENTFTIWDSRCTRSRPVDERTRRELATLSKLAVGPTSTPPAMKCAVTESGTGAPYFPVLIISMLGLRRRRQPLR